MKKQFQKVFFWMALCICVVFASKSVNAAEYRPVPYVDSASKSLVLVFKGFCSEGYNYVLKDEDNDIIRSGELAKDKTSIVVPLTNLQYQTGKRYVLTVTGKDKKSTVTGRYYIDNVLSNLKVSKNNDQSLKVSWSLKGGSPYSKYGVFLHDSKDLALRKAAVSVPNKNATSMIFPSSTLTRSNRYRVYFTSYITVKNVTYYGEGLTMEYDYLRSQSKVKGLKATPNTNRASLSWNAAPGASYYRVYQSTSANGSYKQIATKVTGTSYLVTGLKGGKKYYYKVAAVAEAGSKYLTGKYSSAVVAKIPVVAATPTGVQFSLDTNKNLVLKWNAVSQASGYHVAYKKAGEKSYKKLKNVNTTKVDLSKLDKNTKYCLKVYSYTMNNGKKYYSLNSSKVLKITPAEYLKKNYDRLIASTVRTIGYVGKTKCIYTSKKYSADVKKAFVNVKGYSSSTKYLIWISHYTQQVTIFTGSKGNWNIIRTFSCATGKAETRSPIGVYKLWMKEKGWFYANSKELYVSHYAGRNSFHTRPLYNNGAVKTATIGRPASHGCVRCYNQDAKYIYDNMPIGTTVVSY